MGLLLLELALMVVATIVQNHVRWVSYKETAQEKQRKLKLFFKKASKTKYNIKGPFFFIM